SARSLCCDASRWRFAGRPAATEMKGCRLKSALQGEVDSGRNWCNGKERGSSIGNDDLRADVDPVKQVVHPAVANGDAASGPVPTDAAEAVDFDHSTQPGVLIGYGAVLVRIDDAIVLSATDDSGVQSPFGVFKQRI